MPMSRSEVQAKFEAAEEAGATFGANSQPSGEHILTWLTEYDIIEDVIFSDLGETIFIRFVEQGDLALAAIVAFELHPDELSVSDLKDLNYAEISEDDAERFLQNPDAYLRLWWD